VLSCWAPSKRIPGQRRVRSCREATYLVVPLWYGLPAQASALQPTQGRFYRNRGHWEGQVRQTTSPKGRESRGKAVAQADVLSPEGSSAICVQRFDGSRDSAIHTTYRISLRSSSLHEPSYPLLRVVFGLKESPLRPKPERALHFRQLRFGLDKWLVWSTIPETNFGTEPV
jgi:hypothetical protein